MEKEEYIDTMSKLLNGQIRGAINKKGREENLELIQLTLDNVWNTARELTLGEITDAEVLHQLKRELKDDTERSDP